jgi:8-oxo-dGTP diphosphatase
LDAQKVSTGVENIMKVIEVVAAIIRDGDKILATQRGYGDFAGGWEFPGGKMEQGEAREEALQREIREELDVNIKVDEYLMTIEYDYPNFHLTMHCFFCHVVEGDIKLLEHTSGRWLTKEELYLVNWLPADLDVVERLKQVMI